MRRGIRSLGMMCIVVVATLCSCASTVTSPVVLGPNGIDSLSLKNDVARFVQTNGPAWARDTDPFRDNPCDTMKDLINRYFKVDCNDDGRTDLVVNGTRIIYVMIDKGDGSYSSFLVRRKTSSTRLLYVREVVHRSPRTLIIVDNLSSACYLADSTPMATDTMVIVGGLLVDQSQSPSAQPITSITMVAQGCYGFCPRYTIRIDAARSAFYTAKEYCDTTGDFTATLDARDADPLFEAAHYINPASYPDQLWGGVSDVSEYQFTFVFKDGSTKTILTDAISSTSLTSIINYVETLRTTQQWKQ
jgi:hypothetical protein